MHFLFIITILLNCSLLYTAENPPVKIPDIIHPEGSTDSNNIPTESRLLFDMPHELTPAQQQDQKNLLKLFKTPIAKKEY